MKKLLALLILVLIATLFVGCGEISREAASEKPINTEYTAAYDSVETEYTYKYDFWHGDFVYVPEIKTVHHKEKYEVQYERKYSDGYTYTYWSEVSKAEYEKALLQIEGGAEE